MSSSVESVCAARIELMEEVEQLGDGELGIERGGLELDADAHLDLALLRRLFEAQDGDVPVVGGAQSLDHLDGGGFAGAVGAEHAEDLARLDGEADAVHGLGLAVALAKVLGDDRLGFGCHVCAPPIQEFERQAEPETGCDGRRATLHVDGRSTISMMIDDA